MKKKKFKIPVTLKVVLGYGLIIALAVYSIWFIYGQIETLSKSIEISNENRLRYMQVGEIAANLFVAESISRDIIQNQKNDSLPVFERKIDTINHIISKLKTNYQSEEMHKALDSFNGLLTQKNLNLKELLKLRQEASTESYYAKVISQLKKSTTILKTKTTNGNFEITTPEFEKRLSVLSNIPNKIVKVNSLKKQPIRLSTP